MTILVTGASGLVGTALVASLKQHFPIASFDLRSGPHQDVRKHTPLRGYEGIVHLAAVSRVISAERDPATCVSTNEVALKLLYDNALSERDRPWVIFASSREVYGDAGGDPVKEDAPYAPKNVYARSKVKGEQLSLQAREAGLVVNVVRLSSVYGSAADHADRVAPSFARAAARGGEIRVEGPSHTYDFTHVHDVALGLHALVQQTRHRQLLPPIHLVSGNGTSLAALADLAARHARAAVSMVNAPQRPYGVGKFVGDPGRARELLGWSAQIPVEQGMVRLIDDLAALSAIGERGAPSLQLRTSYN